MGQMLDVNNLPGLQKARVAQQQSIESILPVSCQGC